MKSLFLFILLNLFTWGFTFGQHKELGLSDLIDSYDSVVLVKHKRIIGAMSIDTGKKGERIEERELLMYGDINPYIVVTSYKLNRIEQDSLFSILELKTEGRMSGGCFDPHHTILIYIKGVLSYIDICFMCNSYRADLKDYKLKDIDENKWKLIKSYFESKNLI